MPPKMPFYSPLVSEALTRSAEATLGILGVSDPNLRNYLKHELIQQPGNPTSFLADPVFEHTFAWESAELTMDDLKGTLLPEELVNALDSPPKEYAEQAFKSDWNPYTHQLEAWKVLGEGKKQSLVATSGTGSGKTECFMIPVLGDLVREHLQTQKRLEGVRALFLYPLNALINSQRERLSAWTANFKENIRFCLYNGNTPEFERKANTPSKPNEVTNRRTLRESAPPVLVTNATMLEYMLVRQKDASILEQSQGKLRWILLDEAHTYMGSQAAELSLLLRRVMIAFGVTPEEVRFVATSATIGDKDSEIQLQKFLADIAGISPDQVSVVGGKRLVPSTRAPNQNSFSIEELAAIQTDKAESDQRFNALASNPTAVAVRDYITASPALRLDQISKHIQLPWQDTLEWLDLCTGTFPETGEHAGQAFLPLRAHLFHQVVGGLWSCVDPNCPMKANTPLEKSWPFGKVYTHHRETCECGSIVLDLAFCQECNTPHLLGCDSGGTLRQRSWEVVDEFSLDIEPEEYDEDQEEVDSHSSKFSNDIVVYPSVFGKGVTLTIDRKTGVSTTDEISLAIKMKPVCNGSEPECGKCQFGGYGGTNIYRRCIVGAPFYISNTIPTLLEYCPDSPRPNVHPSRGRRLITFTDSRQGTARLAIKIQQESERNRVRGLVYDILHQMTDSQPEDFETLKQDLERYRTYEKQSRDAGLVDPADDYLKRIQEIETLILGSKGGKPVSWDKVVDRLCGTTDIGIHLLDYYTSTAPEHFSKGQERRLAEMLLMREFARRPKRYNSLETLGLVSVCYPALDKITTIPREWQALKLDLADWKDFLKITLDFFIRENTFFAIPKDWLRWMGAKFYPKFLLAPTSEEIPTTWHRPWPCVRKGLNSRLIRILEYKTRLNLEDSHNSDMLNSIMVELWSALTNTKILIPTDLLAFQLDRSALAFKLNTSAWQCPVTHRLIDTTFKKTTPYLPQHPTRENATCVERAVPIAPPIPTTVATHADRLKLIRDWTRTDSQVNELRDLGLWPDLSDRIIEGGTYLRVAEHSAQQSASKLSSYEQGFKKHRINVMNCSTTMEMGVDIGGISTVVMNNVPPHPANYLQRTGRAGRRREARSVAFTICKDNPHERAIFSNPMWPFVTSIPAPTITLSSSRIIQRHINAFALSKFLRKISRDLTVQADKLDCAWFFIGEEGVSSPYKKFLKWLSSQIKKLDSPLRDGLNRIKHESALQGETPESCLKHTRQAILSISEDWILEYNRFLEEFEKIKGEKETNPYYRRVKSDLKRHAGEYLLSDLARKTYLPGYGFPTDVVTFDPYTIEHYKRSKKQNSREDTFARVQDKPARNLAVALGEYAPGSEVVLDGLVYQSSGIQTHWHKFARNMNEPQRLQRAWKCEKCGASGVVSPLEDTISCEACENVIKTENTREFLEPTGFAVDFYSEPSNDISTQQYIAPNDPWVSLVETELPIAGDPNSLGTYKASSEGKLFFHNSGTHGFGYAICLKCGRAKSMVNRDEFPEGLNPKESHQRLRGALRAGEGAICEGSDNPYAIKPGVHLGATSQTDIVQFFLRNPHDGAYLDSRNEEHMKAAFSIAIAMRQALARILGINAEEMGFAVSPERKGDASVASIVLYDRNSGGAGFASSAPNHLSRLFKETKGFLQCASQCSKACQDCLLTRDTRFKWEYLDRHAALAFITDDFIDRMSKHY